MKLSASPQYARITSGKSVGRIADHSTFAVELSHAFSFHWNGFTDSESVLNIQVVFGLKASHFGIPDYFITKI